MKSGKILKLLGILFVLYLLIGFLLFPLAVRFLAQKSLRQNLSEHASIERVRANPLTFQLKVSGLNIPSPDGAKWIACEEAWIDLSVATLFKWHPVVDSLQLTQPFALIERGPSADSEVPDSDDAGVKAWQEVVAELAVMGIPRVTVHQMAIIDGKLVFADTVTGYREEIEPINLTLLDFTTAQVKDNSLSFVAKTPAGAELALNGRFSIEPRTLNMSVKLSGVDLSGLSPYYEDLTKFTLEKAVFSLSFDLAVNLSDLDALLQLSDGQVALNEVALRRLDDGGRLISFETIALDGIAFHFPQNALTVDRISILSGDTLVRRDAEGALNLLDLVVLPEPVEVSDTSVESAAENALAWQVNTFEVKNYVVIWEDRHEGLEMTTDLIVEDITLSGIEANLSKAVELVAHTRMGEQGRIAVDGVVALDGSQVALNLEVDTVELPIVKPYIQKFAQMKLSSGLLKLNGRVTSDASESGYHFAGAGSLDGLALASADSQQLNVAWETLAFDGIDIGTEPLAISVDTIRMSTPEGRFVRFAAATEEAPVKPDEPTATPDDAETAPLDLRIGQFLATGGEFTFRDESVEPAVDIVIRSIEADVKPIHLAKETTTEVAIKAEINRAQLSVEGNLAPLDPIADTKLSISLAGFSLPAFTPYSGQAIGRAIENGLFNLDSDWTINASQLSAKNTILLDGFRLGENIPSEDAISLPLDLALSLLRRQDGSIKINLPVSGDLSDPKLSVGQLVVQAFVGLIVKTAAAPFSLLSGLVESEKDLSSVSFDPHSSQLSADTMDRLNLLTTALNERPALRLKLVAEISTEDRDAIAAEILREQFAAGKEMDDAKYRRRLYAAYKKKLADAGEDPAKIPEDEKVEIMEKSFLADIKVPGENIAMLKTARIEEVKNYLLNVKQLAAERVSPGEAAASPDDPEKSSIGGVRFEIN